MTTMSSSDDGGLRLYELSLDLARGLSEQFIALEYRNAAQLEEEAARAETEATQALRQARELCEKALEGPLAGDAHAVLAHRLLQLALGPLGSNE